MQPSYDSNARSLRGRSGGIASANRALLEALHRAGSGPFDAATAATLWGLERKRAGRRLRMLAERGWLTRARHGLYWPVPLDAGDATSWTDDPWLLAVRLFPGGYVGGWSAAGHWGLTDQISRDLFVFTPERSAPRDVVSGVTPIRIKVIRPDKVFGTRMVWRRATPVRVSDPSRTVVDLLDDPGTGGGIRHVTDVLAAYFDSDHRDDDLLIGYVDRLGNRTAYKRLGYLAETLGLADAHLLAACRARISKGISLLDPAAARRGPIVTRWHLRLNVAVDA